MLEVLLILGALAIDQTSKVWAATTLAAGGDSIRLIDGVFHLTYTENRGAAFGMLQNAQVLLIAVTIVALAVMIYIMVTERKKVTVWTRIAIALIFAGAAGNFIDRLLLGYVRDFFDFTLINFAIFNVADSCISVGAVLLAVCILFVDGKKLFESEKKPEPANEKQ